MRAWLPILSAQRRTASTMRATRFSASQTLSLTKRQSLPTPLPWLLILTEGAADNLDNAFSYDPYKDKEDPTHHFRAAEWLIPGGVAVFGAICVNASWGKNLRENLHNTFSQKGLNKTSIDNYIQYAPAALTLGLGLCGVKGQHAFKDRAIIMMMSYATMAIVVNAAKYTFKEKRPDSSSRNSFPSGHTATAFVGAEMLYQEYRTTHPWIGYTAYGLSAAVAYLRMHNDRHWANDVLAGAAVGMLSTKFAYWLLS